MRQPPGVAECFMNDGTRRTIGLFRAYPTCWLKFFGGHLSEVALLQCPSTCGAGFSVINLCAAGPSGRLWRHSRARSGCVWRRLLTHNLRPLPLSPTPTPIPQCPHPEEAGLVPKPPHFLPIPRMDGSGCNPLFLGKTANSLFKDGVLPSKPNGNHRTV